MDTTGTVTRLLRAVDAGDPGAPNALLAHVQADLRRIAQSLLDHWPRSLAGTSGTELVNVACIRLLAADRLNAEDRRQFFFQLGRAMHDELVEEARRATTMKRGGAWRRQQLGDMQAEDGGLSADLLDLNAALDDLASVDIHAATVVRLRYFADYSFRETATILGRTLGQVRGDWEYARAWLEARLHPRDDAPKSAPPNSAQPLLSDGG